MVTFGLLGGLTGTKWERACSGTVAGLWSRSNRLPNRVDDAGGADRSITGYQRSAEGSGSSHDRGVERIDQDRGCGLEVRPRGHVERRHPHRRVRVDQCGPHPVRSSLVEATERLPCGLRSSTVRGWSRLRQRCPPCPPPLPGLRGPAERSARDRRGTNRSHGNRRRPSPEGAVPALSGVDVRPMHRLEVLPGKCLFWADTSHEHPPHSLARAPAVLPARHQAKVVTRPQPPASKLLGRDAAVRGHDEFEAFGNVGGTHLVIRIGDVDRGGQ